MKTKILFVIGALRIGGIEKSLVNLLNNIDSETYDITLCLFAKNGEYISDIPDHVNIINNSKILRLLGTPTFELRKKKNKLLYFFRIILSGASRLIGSPILFKLLFALIRTDKNEYDIAISYSHNLSSKSLYFGYNKYVLTKVKSKKKAAWLHTDIIRSGSYDKYSSKEMNRFDYLIFLSKALKDHFELSSNNIKTEKVVIRNTINEKEIRLKIEDVNFKKTKLTKFISIGRFDDNKSFERIIEIVIKASQTYDNFRWIVLGDGPNYEKINSLIEKNNLQKYISLLGSVKNPYKYILNSDYLVITSKYEGVPMVMLESIYLNVPVITTEFEAAAEYIQSGINGIITKNNVDDLYNAICLLLDNKNLSSYYKNNLIHINKGVDDFDKFVIDTKVNANG